MEISPSVVVCDAGPLIHLDELGCLDVLMDFSPIFVPQEVWQEVEHHRPTVFQQATLPLQMIPPEDAPIPPALAQLSAALELDPGEVSALAVMEQYPHAIFLTDDAAARLAAQSLRYTVHGTIGLLLRAIRRQQRSKAEIVAILEDLPTLSTLHIAPRLLREVTEEVRRYESSTS